MATHTALADVDVAPLELHCTQRLHALDGLVDRLLEHQRDDFGQTPLHYAVRNGNTVTLGLLLKAGADPNAKDTEYGSTPLHLAATLKADDLIRDLVAAGADPGLARKNGENAEQLYEKYHSKPFPAE